MKINSLIQNISKSRYGKYRNLESQITYRSSPNLYTFFVLIQMIYEESGKIPSQHLDKLTQFAKQKVLTELGLT